MERDIGLIFFFLFLSLSLSFYSKNDEYLEFFLVFYLRLATDAFRRMLRIFILSSENVVVFIARTDIARSEKRQTFSRFGLRDYIRRR